ncbi:hypothetical protein [Roseivirga sp. E12]|uniref:hypothetical protein n=1 Tax=Roseivirga sp. E12 TaxID=2819237 RepID=UPI001ABC00C8|nr:hypothetical protein [Roseivirga sp. E12]MBO3697008.1 hypothetical protein [Roseivirga sp. E12]
MTESKKKFSRSDIASFLAVIMSVAALFIGIIEARIMAEQQEIMAQQQKVMVEQQKGAVWPYMEVKSGVTILNQLSDSLTFNSTAENKGVGPAIVKEISIQILDKAYNDFRDFTNAMDSIMGKDKYELLQFAIRKSPNSVYKPGETRNLFSIKILDKEDFYAKIGFFNLSLKYCSIYDDCWMENGKEIEE